MLTVITGPPCSGKSTYARQHAHPGDVLVDFDALAVALGSTDAHDHGSRLREVAAAAWSAAIREAIRQHRMGARVWVVDSWPSPHRRDGYAAAGARMVALTADRAELHRRSDADGRPAVMHARIDQFLAAPAPPGRDPAPASRTSWLPDDPYPRHLRRRNA